MSPRKDLTPAGLIGRRPAVRVFEEGGRVKVMWREHGHRQYATYAATREGRIDARAHAAGVFDRLTASPSGTRLTIRELWRRYQETEFPRLAPRSRILYAGRWRKWELFIGGATLAELVATEAIARFRTEMTRQHAVAQVRAMIRVVKIVYNWADELELISRNRVAKYTFKLGKHERPTAPAEYRTAHWEALLRQLSGGQDGRRWKTWAAVLVAGSQGERINAVLQLTWADVDWAGGRIWWRPETNKQGRGRWQPMTWEGYAALLTARWWADRRATDPHLARERRRPVGPWVFPSARHADRRYPYAAAHAMLVAAEEEAKVPHLPWRAFHGLRKMAAGDVAARTGDPWLALQWIGDTDPRRAKEYLLARDDRMQQIASYLPQNCHTADGEDDGDLVGVGGQGLTEASGGDRTHDRLPAEPPRSTPPPRQSTTYVAGNRVQGPEETPQVGPVGATNLPHHRGPDGDPRPSPVRLPGDHHGGVR